MQLKRYGNLVNYIIADSFNETLLNMIFFTIESRVNKVLELQADDTVTLKDKVVGNVKQMWTRKIVDEVNDWFIWSNKDKDEEDIFLTAIDESELKMKGTI